MKQRLLLLSKLAFVFMFLLSASIVFGQKKLSGTVIDQNGETLPGVTVVVKGTTLGTVTNLNGVYNISVPETADTLVFSFIGMTTIAKPITGSVIDCQLGNDYQVLEEVLVIGYGTMKKEDKTGAVAQVKAEELNGGVLTDPMQAMQGKSAGVMVTKKGGDPNEGFKVRIRGASGFDSNTQPLYVIDGVPGVDPTTIAPEDIATFNILKDAASTAIYGSQGSNGVIIITTKKGKLAKKGQKTVSNINYNSKASFDWVANKLDLMDGDEIRAHAQTLLREAQIKNPQYTIDSVFDDGGANTDWQDEIYRTGITYSNNISFSGGNQTSTYYASITHANWEGVMKGTEKERTIAKINLTHNALNDRLKLSGSLSNTFEENDYENYSGWGLDDIIYQSLSRNPTDPVYNSNGGYYKTSRVFNYENPIAVINEIENKREAKRFLGNMKADFEIIDGLVASANIAYTRDDHENLYFRPKGVYETADNGYAKREYNDNVQKLFESTLNYKKSLNDIHNFDVIGGYSWQRKIYKGFWAQARDAQSEYLLYNDLQAMNDITYGDIDSWKGESTLIGFFGRVQYNFNHKYYASSSIRRDGSSKFGDNNKWGWFPTFALGWNMHTEEFMQGIGWLDQLKLRVSYGISGNQEIGEYRSLVAWQTAGQIPNPSNGEMVVAYEQAWNANPDLKWEETTEINIGTDFAFINSRISGSIDVYQKKTKDLLGIYSVPVPPNMATTTYANSGELENKGIELYLQAYIVDNKNLEWKTSTNISHNKSEILSLGDYNTEGIRKEGYISGRGMVGDNQYVTGIMVGEEIGSFYLPKYVTVKSGSFVYEAIGGGYTLNQDEAKREIVGTASPDIEIGWSNSFTFVKRWTLDFSFRSMIGNDVYNATKMFFDAPQNLPSLNGLPEAIDWYDKGRTQTASTIADIYVEDASFLRLDYLAVGYNFNVTKVNWLQKLRLYAASNNLFTITGYSGIDPETSIDGLAYGIDQYNVYPKTKTITLGLNASF